MIIILYCIEQLVKIVMATQKGVISELRVSTGGRNKIDNNLMKS